MFLSIWSNIGDKISDFFEMIKNFFIDNSRNPVLWIGIVLLGLLLFEFVYKALHKD